MIFASLFESAQKNELLLVDGGICQWHLRRDNKIVIKVIISTRPGAGKEMLAILKMKNASGITLKCPVGYESNKWWKKRGFELVITRDGLNEWWFPLAKR